MLPSVSHYLVYAGLASNADVAQEHNSSGTSAGIACCHVNTVVDIATGDAGRSTAAVVFLRNVRASSIILSPVGKADHNCILVKTKCYYAYNKAVSRVVTKQYLSEQVLDNLAYVINGILWQVCTGASSNLPLYHTHS